MTINISATEDPTIVARNRLEVYQRFFRDVEDRLPGLSRDYRHYEEADSCKPRQNKWTIARNSPQWKFWDFKGKDIANFFFDVTTDAGTLKVKCGELCVERSIRDVLSDAEEDRRDPERYKTRLGIDNVEIERVGYTP